MLSLIDQVIHFEKQARRLRGCVRRGEADPLMHHALLNKARCYLIIAKGLRLWAGS